MGVGGWRGAHAQPRLQRRGTHRAIRQALRFGHLPSGRGPEHVQGLHDRRRAQRADRGDEEAVAQDALSVALQLTHATREVGERSEPLEITRLELDVKSLLDRHHEDDEIQ